MTKKLIVSPSPHNPFIPSKQIRKLRGDISQLEMEFKTGISANNISVMERNNTHSSSYHTLCRIAQGMGVHCVVLFVDDKELERMKNAEREVRTEALYEEYEVRTDAKN